MLEWLSFQMLILFTFMDLDSEKVQSREIDVGASAHCSTNDE